MKTTDFSKKPISNFISENCYYAITIRSPALSGKIISIEFPHLPRDYRFITFDDIPGKHTIHVGNTDIPILADRIVQYTGQPVALLTGPDKEKLHYYADNVKMIIEPQVPETSYKTFSYKQSQAKIIYTQGNPDIAFLQSTTSIEHELQISVAYSYHPDTYSAFCMFDYDKMELYTVYCQPALIHKAICDMLKIKPENLVIKHSYSPPSYASKIWYPAMVSCHTALAAFFSGKPVAMIYSREEDYLYSPAYMPQSTISMKTGMDEQGSLLAMDIVFCTDFGWQAPYAHAVLEQFSETIKDIYTIPHIRIQNYAVQTNTPPHDSFTALGTSHGIIAMEKNIDLCASLARIDPIQFRKKNLNSSKKYSKTSLSVIFDEVTNKLLKLSDFNRKFASCKLVNVRKTVGLHTSSQKSIGFAFGCQNQTPYYQILNNTQTSITVTLKKNLEISIVIPYMPDNSESLEIFKNTASEIFGLPKSSIKISEKNILDERKSNYHYSFETSTLILNDLIKKACLDIQKKRFRDTLPISSTKIYRQNKRTINNSSTAKSFGAAVVEIECSGIALQPVISEIWMVVNAGRILDKTRARNSLMLDIELAISKLIMSDNPDSCCYNTRIPEIKHIPITIDFIETNTEPKSIGELAYGLIPAATINALQLISDESITDDILYKHSKTMLKNNLYSMFSYNLDESAIKKE